MCWLGHTKFLMGLKYVPYIYMSVCECQVRIKCVLIATYHISHISDTNHKVSEAWKTLNHYWGATQRITLRHKSPDTERMIVGIWLATEKQGSHVYSPMCYQFPQHLLINPKPISLNPGNHGEQAEQKEENRWSRGSVFAFLSRHRSNAKACMCVQICAHLSVFKQEILCPRTINDEWFKTCIKSNI